MFCTTCGKETPANSAFCLHCGNKILGLSPSPNLQTSPIIINHTVPSSSTGLKVFIGFLLLALFGLSFLILWPKLSDNVSKYPEQGQTNPIVRLSPSEIATKEEATKTIHKALMDNDKGKFQACVTLKVLGEVGGDFDNWYEVWRQEAEKHSVSEWVNNPPTLEYEFNGWKLAEK